MARWKNFVVPQHGKLPLQAFWGAWSITHQSRSREKQLSTKFLRVFFRFSPKPFFRGILGARGTRVFGASRSPTPSGTERISWNLDGLDNTQRGGNRQIRMVITTPEAVQEVRVLSNG